MKRIVTITAMLCMAILSIYAQDMIGAMDKKLIPPTPTSAVFKKYMGEQPALATGSVNVNVPLYTLRCHDISIPLTLRYNTNGIKVLDDPIPFGYGWVLIPGLRMTRTILGRPDEMFRFIGDFSRATNDYVTLQRCMSDGGIIRQPNPKKYDSQRDIFTLSLIDKNHTFILDKSNSKEYTFKGVNSSELKLSADTALNNITVIDGKGVKYTFGEDKELADEMYITAWMLNRIDLPNGDKIEFSWIGEVHTVNRFQTLAPDYYYDNFGGYYPEEIYPGEKTSSNQTGNRIVVSPYKISQQLHQITFPNGTIDFKYHKNKDYDNPRIKQIEIRNSNSIVKTIDFAFGKYEELFVEESYLLKEIRISDEGIYSFDYNPERFRVKALDSWGYFNGKDKYEGFPSLVPKIKIKCYDCGYYQEVGSADKSIDAQKMQANILTSVTYPTGGKTTFEYEPHRFKNTGIRFNNDIDSTYNVQLSEGGGLRVTKVTTTTGNTDDTPIIKRYVYGKNENGLAQCVVTPILETFVTKYRTIYLDMIYKADLKPCYEHTVVYINPFSNYSDYNIGQTIIWYDEVTEYCESENGEKQGKSVYKFKDHVPYNMMSRDGYGNPLLLCLNKAFAKGPLMVSEERYKYEADKYELVHRTNWNYKIASSRKEYKNIFIVRNYCTAHGYDSPDFDENGKAFVPETRYQQYISAPTSAIYGAYEYFTYPKIEQLDSKIETYYTDNGEYSTVETYSYIYDTEIISGKTVSSSNGMSDKLKLYYPHTASSQSDSMTDYASQAKVFDKMIGCNILSVPVYTVMFNNGDSVASQNLFAYYGKSLYLPYKVIMKRGSGKPICLGTYGYDSVGNMRSRTSPDGLKETFLWGYKGQYPVLHVQGYDFSQVYEIAGNKTDIYDFPTNSGTSVVNDLRKLMPDNSLVATYTYKPLVGMTSYNDPAEVNYDYYYDSHNRLQSIVDRSRGTVQEFAYNMANESFSAEIIDSGKTYTIGDDIYLSCEVEHSSGNVSYTWSMLDSKNMNIKLSKNTGSSISCRNINEIGDITVKCAAVDELKNEIAVCSKIIHVDPEIIGFSDISDNNGSNGVSAILKCSNPIKVKFRLMVSILNGSCSLYVGDTSYSLSEDSRDFTFEKDFSPGTHGVNLSFDDSSSQGEVIFYIVNISGVKNEILNSQELMISR